MISRIDYLRAERANIDRLRQECREAVPHLIDEGASEQDPAITLTRRIDLLDYAIAEWETVAKRTL